jgi:hypothetical protein
MKQSHFVLLKTNQANKKRERQFALRNINLRYKFVQLIITEYHYIVLTDL